MADFLPSLWSSIFTPGPTPTLLLATNLTFASLQLLLFALLLATYSIHFLILSGLCGGLWASINWFARELIAAEAKEKEAKRLRQREKERRDEARGGQEEADDEGEETETEGDGATASMIVVDPPTDSTTKQSNTEQPTPHADQTQSETLSSTNETLRQRKPAPSESVRSEQSQSSLHSANSLHEAGSTDSEWEKVDDKDAAAGVQQRRA
ncbi:Pkr1-domain-containing protein [Dissoconium aciculare CBS 342.82]|uniref:Pkr1-domain-containing protein n=1 Tax=Dissoconium aciculare CBS 342.82 TaxID=1314786 RepID=A0A6J3LTZ6_9PEZI|nr:Pkr1-domain-containing protein [Dissoconium aciculare CBS 342.82]KAF1818749.1 Pkr1-domain-containing protein [Dissoconium aciculare CBS 342.82]